MDTTSKQKVLYLITKSNWGGAQRYVYDLATSLPKETYEAIVVLGGQGPLKEKLDATGIRTISILNLKRDISLTDEIKSFFTILRILRAERPHVVHVNSSKAGGLGALAGRIAGVQKIIFTAHAWAFNENRSKVVQLIILFLHWCTIAFSHTTIAVSENIREQMSELPFIQQKIKVVKHGLQPTPVLEKKEARDILCARSQTLQEVSTSNPIWIGSVAELHPVKDHANSIKALSKLRHTHSEAILVILGEGEERARLEDLIKNLHLEKKVFLLGHVADAQQYMSAFDIFLLSSRSEALGYVLLEAGDASVPVIATDIGGIPEIVTDKKSGLLVPPQSPEGTSKALHQLITNQIQAKKYAQHLKQVIEQKYSFTHMLQQTYDLYV